jgi:hypothetical protein
VHRAVVPFEHEVHLEFPRTRVEELGPDSGAAPLPIIFGSHGFSQFSSERNDVAAVTFGEFLDREPAKLEAGGENEAQLQADDLSEIA